KAGDPVEIPAQLRMKGIYRTAEFFIDHTVRYQRPRREIPRHRDLQSIFINIEMHIRTVDHSDHRLTLMDIHVDDPIHISKYFCILNKWVSLQLILQVMNIDIMKVLSGKRTAGFHKDAIHLLTFNKVI